jgi:hypothetical protein
VKEFIGTAVNLLLAEDGDKFIGTAEMVLIYSEPHFKPNGSGLDRVRESGEFRIAITVGGMRQLSRYLVGYADSLEELECRANSGVGDVS